MKYFIFRNQTIEPFWDNNQVSFSGYDDISLIPDDVESYIWFYQVPPGEDDVVAEEVKTFLDKLRLVLDKILASKQFIIFSLCSLSNVNIVGSRNTLMIAINEFNQAVLDLANNRGNVRFIDFSKFVNQYPHRELVNWKFYFISQTLLNPKLAKDFQYWWKQKEKELALKRKKCLVLDLDNTLWGGILGEDGVAGIKIGGDYPGKAFSYWQRSLLELKRTGVMLAICSKNNEADVIEAWENNPFMILRKDDFVAWRINWHDKASNIQELAAELNIGLDSMVFIDNNPTERELIRQLLPVVETPDFPDKPHQLMSFFEELVNSYFRVYSVTSEDLKKTEQYKANAQRVAAQARFTDFNKYLKSLDINLEIQALDEFNLQRVAQMTQKTNQFNLTTHRYTENDIQQMSNEGALIYAISVSDRFGDNGITGEIILRPLEKDTMLIDTLLLSCRILGKGIEFAFLDTIINLVANKGIKRLKASYHKTAKNSQVADFYDKAGFRITHRDDDSKDYELIIDKQRDKKDIYTITIK